MRNIHIIPTDKPSRLGLHKNGELQLHTNSLTKNLPYFSPQNIYITTDSEIKEGDWYCSPGGLISKHNGTEKLPIGWKKIIVTTDQDLIKDGVQAIDDEFLDWFCSKNGEVDFVEVIAIEDEKN